MVSVTAHTIELTAESLQEDLARLRMQKQALERELAAVVAHLSSVQRALSALEPLMLNPATAAVAGSADAASAQPGRLSPGPADTTPKAAPPPRKPRGGKDTEPPVATGADADADAQKSYGKLTEQIMEYFAGVGDVDVRARDVAAALGRDTDSGSINGVRSTLDRLVGASRVQRTGRGLYRARRS